MDLQRSIKLQSRSVEMNFIGENDRYYHGWAGLRPPEDVRDVKMCGQCNAAMRLAIYAEGTRKFKSGKSADGLLMPKEIHAWLTDYLRLNY